jgi:hypothetical protein
MQFAQEQSVTSRAARWSCGQSQSTYPHNAGTRSSELEAVVTVAVGLYYPAAIALGLVFFAASFLLPGPTPTMVALILAVVVFILAFFFAVLVV